MILALAHRPQAAATPPRRRHDGGAPALPDRPGGGARGGRSRRGPERPEPTCSRRPNTWTALDRPLEATRARLLAGQLLRGHDDDRARELLEQAASQSEELGVPHLAEKARALAAGSEQLHQG